MGSVTIGSPEWLWPCVGLVGLVLILMWRRYRAAARMPAGAKVLAGGLKVAGLILLCLCLVDLQWREERAATGENLVLVMADGSRGMGIADGSAGEKTRGEILKEVLGRSAGDWQESLEGEYQVRRYVFGQRLEGVADFEGLEFDRPVSDLGRTLNLLKERYGNRPVAGVVLLSDGNATDVESAADWDEAFFEGAPPVYPVLIGEGAPERDLGIVDVLVSETVFEDAPVTVDVDVMCRGYAGEAVELRLLDEAGETVEKQEHVPGEAEERHRFRMRLKPGKRGVLFYEAVLGVKGEGEAEESEFEAVAADEATLENNRRMLMVDRGEGPYRVLYVSGRPNWEYKFFRRALAADDEVELTALVRVAKREPKFEWRGRSGESSNPLFRGFGRDDPEEDTSYDKPVLVRLDTQDGAELEDGFPSAPEDLYSKFDVIVIDDLEASFFTHAQMELLSDFVSRRGGGLLMLGGQESYQLGGYDDTPLAAMLPVYLDRVSAAGAADRDMRFELTREGWLEPWLRLRDEETGERERLEGMPGFRALNRVRAIKPGASLLATAVSAEDGAMVPAVVGQRFGEGRVLAVTVGDWWRWGFRSEEMRPDMEKAWRQMVRWLMADVPSLVELTVERGRAEDGRQLSVETRVRDDAFEPMDNVLVEVKVAEVGEGKGNEYEDEYEGERGGHEAVVLDAEPSDEEAGVFGDTVSGAKEGAFRAVASVRGEDGEVMGEAGSGWVVDLAAEEYRRLEPNEELMSALAERTGGEVISVEGLEEFVRSMPERGGPVTEVRSEPLWHRPWVFLLALGCFAGEWGVRRRWGAA
ncbi:MAG: hypothetical protein AAF591_23440 [Verrucomicrobiota bacterium]